MTLRGKNIFLRFPSSSDCDILLKWENDPDIWNAGDNKTPYSRKEMEEFLSTGQDLDKLKQVRYMICLINDDRPVGCIDLFDYNKVDSNIGVGVLIYDNKDRGNGYAGEALSILMSHIKTENDIKEIHCQVFNHNTASLRLFEKAGFNAMEIVNSTNDLEKSSKTLFKKEL